MKITPKDSETTCDNIYFRSGKIRAKDLHAGDLMRKTSQRTLFRGERSWSAKGRKSSKDGISSKDTQRVTSDSRGEIQGVSYISQSSSWRPSPTLVGQGHPWEEKATGLATESKSHQTHWRTT